MRSSRLSLSRASDQGTASDRHNLGSGPVAPGQDGESLEEKGRGFLPAPGREKARRTPRRGRGWPGRGPGETGRRQPRGGWEVAADSPAGVRPGLSSGRGTGERTSLPRGLAGAAVAVGSGRPLGTARCSRAEPGSGATGLAGPIAGPGGLCGLRLAGGRGCCFARAGAGIQVTQLPPPPTS